MPVDSDHRASTAARVVLAAAAAFSGGCAVMQPYQIHYAAYSEGPKWCAAAKVHHDRSAIAFARRVQTNLLCQAQQHSAFASGLGAALIPLAGLVAYKGVSGAGTHNIAALSTAGFAAYSVGTYVYRPRDLIYLSGISTIDCAVRLTSPAIVDPALREQLETAMHDGDATAWFLRASTQLDTFGAAIGKAGDVLSELRALAGDLDHGALRSVREQAREAIAQADDELAEHDSAYRALDDDLGGLRARAASYSQRVANRLANSRIAERDLYTAVEAIQAQVSLQLASMQPDPKALASLLSGLKFPAPATPAPASVAKPAAHALRVAEDAEAAAPPLFALGFDPDADLPDDALALRARTRAAIARLAAALDATRTARRNLDTSVLAIHRIVAAEEALIATGEDPIDLARLVADCSLDAHRPVPLTVSVPPGGLDIANGATIRIPVVGGAKPYSATVVDPPAKGALAIQIVVGLGNAQVLEMTASGFEAAATLHVLVQDARGALQSFAIDVAPPAAEEEDES